MATLAGKTILILATHGFEQSELDVPHAKLKEAGATVHVASPEAGEIKGWNHTDWGTPVKVDKSLDEVDAGAYDAIVLPGGQMNPDTLRGNPKAVSLVRSFFEQGKVVAAVCHAPWLLIDAGIAKGRRLTSFKTIKTDLINAGARWEDETVIADEGVVTSRNPDDLPAFVDKIVEEVREGRHQRRAA